MTSLTRHVAITGAALATAGALIAATPTINAGHGLTLASAPAVTTISSAIQLMSDSEWQGNSEWHGNSEGHGHGGGGAQVQGYQESDDDANDAEGSGDDDHHHHGGGFGNIGTIISDFLTNNQAQVLSVTSQIPTFYVASVTLGNALLANAYYTGFDSGSGLVTGLPGVVAYVKSQIGVPSGNLVQDVVVGLTSLTPRINIGPLAVGHGILAGKFFNGYDNGNGNLTGLPGVISYVTDSLGLQAAPGAAVKAVKAVAPAAAVVAARSAVAVAAPAAADSSAAGTAKADTASGGRSALGRATAKAASSAGHARSAAARAAAK
jgi:hypothetical protein